MAAGGGAVRKAVEIAVSSFGAVASGPVHRVDLSAASGLAVSVISYGAGILSVRCPGRGGSRAEEVTMQAPDLAGVLEHAKGTYFGATVGRIANRIKHGRFSLDGAEYALAVNNGENHLHGGVVGFDKRNWALVGTRTAEDGSGVVEFGLVSEDGDEGYPGRLEVTTTYTLSPSSALTIEYAATVAGDKATIVNLANHAYWNLSGDLREGLERHELSIDCAFRLDRSPHDIPTGAYVAVEGTPFDFRKPVSLGDAHAAVKGVEPGYFDHFFTRGDDAAIRAWTQPAEPLPIARLHHAASGRSMLVATTHPGVQLYTGHYLPLPEVAATRPPPYDRHIQYGALCLETQHHSDAINHPHFPSVVLRPGQKYHHRTIHQFEW